MAIKSWDKSQRLTIGSIAKLFGLNTSTLRFWESQGLLKAQRNKENNYRDFDYQSILDISDLVLMKNMGMSLRSMREFPQMGLADIRTLYENRSEAITRQISQLQEILRKVSATRELMQEFNEVYMRREILPSEPDVLQLIPHKRLDDPVAWRKYFAGEYQFGMVMLPDGGDYREAWGWIPSKREEADEIIWEYKPGERSFSLTALRIAVEDRRENNIDELRAMFSSLGRETGMIVARYVCTACEGGVRNDYYKAWIELL